MLFGYPSLLSLVPPAHRTPPRPNIIVHQQSSVNIPIAPPTPSTSPQRSLLANPVPSSEPARLAPRRGYPATAPAPRSRCRYSGLGWSAACVFLAGRHVGKAISLYIRQPLLVLESVERIYTTSTTPAVSSTVTISLRTTKFYALPHRPHCHDAGATRGQ